jgi:dolichol-phosphate mannosyltransferase
MAADWNRAGVTRIALVCRTDESGLTSAIQRGIDEALTTYNADVVTWMDCDLSMPPEDVPRLVDTIVMQGADVAVGSRWISGGADIAHGLMACALSRTINGFAVWMLGSRVHDYTSGFIAARSSLLRAVRLRGDYGEYCIDFLGRAVRQGYEVIEVPYVCVPRTAGESKTGANLWDYVSKGSKYVQTVWRLRQESWAARDELGR